MYIAFIDDKVDNLDAWRSGMEEICDKQAELTTYVSVDAFEEALEEGYRPDMVFTDYHIDDRCGTEVVEALRYRFGQGVYIIAHSSQMWRNEHLLQLGANEIVPKLKRIFPSPTLGERFWCFDDLLELAIMKGYP
jgi:DNA-binding NarL/FixJ family response regulator